MQLLSSPPGLSVFSRIIRFTTDGVATCCTRNVFDKKHIHTILMGENSFALGLVPPIEPGFTDPVS